jgi:hypothetical protein
MFRKTNISKFNIIDSPGVVDVYTTGGKKVTDFKKQKFISRVYLIFEF